MTESERTAAMTEAEDQIAYYESEAQRCEAEVEYWIERLELLSAEEDE